MALSLSIARALKVRYVRVAIERLMYELLQLLRVRKQVRLLSKMSVRSAGCDSDFAIPTWNVPADPRQAKGNREATSGCTLCGEICVSSRPKAESEPELQLTRVQSPSVVS